MSNARTTTPPITPPAMAPTLVFEVELAAKVLVVFPDDVVAAAAEDDDDDDDDDDDAVGPAEDWGNIDEDITVLARALVGEGSLGESVPELEAVPLVSLEDVVMSAPVVVVSERLVVGGSLE